MLLERVLGFDARVAVEAVGKYWDAGRRRAYLLRDDVDYPLSVDPLVWPSLFDLGNGIGFAPEERARLGLAGQLGASSALPAWTGPNRPLWEDLAALRSHLRAPGGAMPVGVLVGVAVRSSGADSPRPEAGWERLGYDVADGSLISGISNCSYGEREARELPRVWASRLNMHHLFEDPAAALEFCRTTNDRVPEHAPFFVYGLYRLEATQ